MSFVCFWASYNYYSTYYVTLWAGPYFFVGYWTYSITNWKLLNHIVGLFIEVDFHIGKYIGEYQNSIQQKEPYLFFTYKVFDPDMQFVHCYFSFEVEYRVGKRIEK